MGGNRNCSGVGTNGTVIAGSKSGSITLNQAKIKGRRNRKFDPKLTRKQKALSPVSITTNLLRISALWVHFHTKKSFMVCHSETC